MSSFFLYLQVVKLQYKLQSQLRITLWIILDHTNLLICRATRRELSNAIGEMHARSVA